MKIQRWKRILLWLGGVALLAISSLMLFSATLVDRLLNRTAWDKKCAITPEAEALHKALTIAHLHDDALMWPRDPLKRHGNGHVDMPRMVEGNQALQTFSIVTQPNFRQLGGLDAAGLLFFVERWPMRTWSSLIERAKYQAQRFHDLETRSNGAFRCILTAKQLDDFLAARAANPQLTAGLLSVEGLHCLEGKAENVDVLYDAGVRMAGFAHFSDNETGGSAHGLQRGGLTPLGEDVLKRLEEKHIIVDLAHASEKLLDDVLDRATRPLLVSHTGIKGAYDSERNITDAHARRVAEKGGIIGIAYFHWVTGGNDIPAIVRSIRYGIQLVGVDHIALGSDFDGTVKVPLDCSGLAMITSELLREEVSEDDIVKIMGGNVMRLLRETLPKE